ncbi:hypothetical protein [Profundibacter sp.]
MIRKTNPIRPQERRSRTTTSPARGDNACVRGPLAGGAADMPAASLLNETTGGTSHRHGGAPRQCRNEAPPPELYQAESNLRTGLAFAVLIGAAAWAAIAAVIFAARYIF